jgi:outer membrane protein OmpA-like peptidoglycan-associated protein
VNRINLFFVGMSLAMTASAAPPAMQRNFIACPILQDTKTVPCWLADYDGQRYYLGIQIDASAEFYPPHLGHRVMVEGTITNDEICGGKVIKPIKISVMPDLDPTCNTMLPAVDKYTVPFAPRGPGPRAKLEELRARGERPYAPPTTPREELSPPYKSREFVVYYDFDSEIANRFVRELGAASNYAKTIGAKHIEITAYRGAVALSNGETAIEKDFIAQRRAQRLADTFKALGFTVDIINAKWQSNPDTASGIEDWRNRRATIEVKPL